MDPLGRVLGLGFGAQTAAELWGVSGYEIPYLWEPLCVVKVLELGSRTQDVPFLWGWWLGLRASLQEGTMCKGHVGPNEGGLGRCLLGRKCACHRLSYKVPPLSPCTRLSTGMLDEWGPLSTKVFAFGSYSQGKVGYRQPVFAFGLCLQLRST